MTSRTALLWTLAYAGAVIFISAHHEVWKDEVGVFSIIHSHPNFLSALADLKQYGHPFLWYAVLWIFNLIIQAPIALKVAHISVAVLAAWIFVKKAPFSCPEKILFLLGYFPLYEYAVINRNYSVSVLMLFVVSALYSSRFNRTPLYSLAVFLLAQAHLLTWLVALMLSLCLLIEMIVRRKIQWFPILILVTGLILSFYSAFPDKATRATHFLDIHFTTWAQEIGKSLIQCFYAPPKIRDLFGIKNVWVLSGILCGFYGLLSKKPMVLILLLGCFGAFNLFFNTVYHGGLRHYGILYILLWAIVWIWRTEQKREDNPEGVRDKWIGIFIVLLALPQIAMGYQAIDHEIRMDYSASKSAGALISKDPALREAILISEPPEHAEALPYYIHNQIFIPRENRFGTTVSMRKSQMKTEYSLDELLRDAATLRQQHGKPVIILLGPGIANAEAGSREWGHGLTFSYSNEAIDLLSRSTKKIGGFYGTISSENYEMFLMDTV